MASHKLQTLYFFTDRTISAKNVVNSTMSTLFIAYRYPYHVAKLVTFIFFLHWILPINTPIEKCVWTLSTHDMSKLTGTTVNTKQMKNTKQYVREETIYVLHRVTYHAY